jgi:hypothetical protein
MKRVLRGFLIASIILGSGVGTMGVARADVENSTGTNVQEGDNRSSGNQRGSSSSGDAVGGQVTGVVSSGRTSVDATNVSRDSDVSSGEASGSNNANTFTGLNSSEDTNIGAGASDVTGVTALNLQEGDNRTTYSQTSSYTTGDGVGGQVIGAVTAAGGSTSIVAANTSTDVSVDTGDAEGDSNDLAAFTGLNESDTISVVAADIEDSCNLAGCANVQEGDNRTRVRQSETASTGDGVAGQVIGAVSAGATSIDATNRSDGVDVQTGDATTDNDASLFTGLNSVDGATEIGGGAAADVIDTCADTGCDNVQEGDNNTSVNQSASASSGDGVAGEVIGAVTSAGGSASIVAANTSLNSDVTTGDAESNNDLASFVGLQTAGPSGTVIGTDIEGSCIGCFNVQEGDNGLSGSQTARSSTGDGVAGQVLGAVSAGATSIDATNRSEDVSVQTGEAESNNDAAEFVGLNVGPTLTVGEGVASDIEDADALNLQEGDNRKSLSQSADASSGDAVAGQVGGVVTSAGGSASVVLANTSTGIDSSTGDTEFNNDEDAFVGLNVTGIIT